MRGIHRPKDSFARVPYCICYFKEMITSLLHDKINTRNKGGHAKESNAKERFP